MELSDAEYLAQRKRRRIAADVEVAPAFAPSPVASSSAAPAPSPAPKPVEVPNPRLFVRNLAASTTEQALRQAFERFGKVVELHVSARAGTGSVAFVTFADAAHADEARRQLDRTRLNERLLQVLPAAEKPAPPSTSTTGKRSRKRARRDDTAVWASLFVGSDAVAALAASRLGIAKGDLIGGDSSDAASKLALAETAFLAELRKYFETHGVLVDRLAARGPPAPDALLIKNLPAGTTEGSVRDLLSPHGVIDQLLVPPAGLVAIARMAETEAATAARRALAYRKLGSSVLYVDRVPSDAFTVGQAPSDADGDAPQPSSARDDPVPTERASVYVKGLAFDTTDAALSAAFGGLPGFVAARVSMRPATNGSTSRRNQGFGFVDFRSPSEAEAGVSAISGFVLDGQTLAADIARRKAATAEVDSSAAALSDTKLVVKNLPFEASKRDLQLLFSAHAQVKHIRLPRKADRTPRGFAFVELHTKRDADAVLVALRDTHLLGRHLVIQRSESDDGASAVERLRALERLNDRPQRDVRRRVVEKTLAEATGRGDDREDDAHGV